jgi:hypothetical protein
MSQLDTRGPGGQDQDGNAGAARHCSNCQVRLSGPYCHACGQPLQSPVRELWALTRDGLSELLSLDGKFFSSLIPLLFKPGTLTLEYLSGRRFSFLRPFRLYLGISIALFLLISVRGDGVNEIDLDPPTEVSVVAPVVDIADPTGVATTAPIAVDPLKALGFEDELAAPATQIAVRPPTDEKRRGFNLVFNGKQWDPRIEPMDLPWVPHWLDEYLNSQMIIIVENGHAIERDPRRLIRSMLDYLPQSMFFLLPGFALLLKLIYLFKRRLYAEHLIVALHSHSFLFLSLLLILLLESSRAAWPAAQGLLFGVQIAILVWMPIYLLIMQKRVYRQGWIWTLLKYAIVGFLYLMLIVLTISLAFLLALRFLQ